MSALRTIGGVALLVTLGGCVNAVVFSTSNHIGIDLNALEGGQQSAKVGIQREEAVAMPVCANAADWKHPSRPCTGIRKQAYSTMAASEVQTGTLLLAGLTSVQIAQVFATGTAAQKGTAPRAVAETFAALRDVPALPADVARAAKYVIDSLASPTTAEQKAAMVDAVTRRLDCAAAATAIDCVRAAARDDKQQRALELLADDISGLRTAAGDK